MAFEAIDKNLVDQYSSNVQMLAQQKASKLLPLVTQEVATGERSYFEQYGVHGSITQVTSRLTDQNLKDVKTARRAVDIAVYTDARGIDNFDKVRMLADMSSSTVMAQGAQCGRQIDENILVSLRGTAKTGKTGSTNTSLPAAQKVAIDSNTFGGSSGDSFMTRSKAQEAMSILQDNSFDEEEMFFVLDGSNYQSLLAEDQASSSRYIDFRPFQNGSLPFFLGARIVVLPKARFELNSTTGIYNFLVAKPAVLSVSGSEGLIKSKVYEDDKKEVIGTYVAHTNLYHAATRMQEEGVVEIENKQR